ncbi:hypothetical protein [Castellaniella sp.]|uniref:hypothetical protein n=1 Tax=Castellaniella sp. TaxID=1955812 RepID=UPI002AFDFF30|nr:hypothetical protein [Castellaniella sp.]
MSTQYTSYSQVPWYRKWWFAIIGAVIFMPAIIVMAFFGNFYFSKKGEIQAFPKWYKFVLLGFFILAIIGSILETKQINSESQETSKSSHTKISEAELKAMFQEALNKPTKPAAPEAAQENSTNATPADKHAACPNDKLIFACTTAKGKAVAVCDSGETLQYNFGKKGQSPELSLSVPRSEASTFQWDGRGNSITYSVQIPNGNTAYEVFVSTDRMSEEHEMVAGINVEVSGQHVSTITCQIDTLQHDIEDISLKPVEWQ